MSDNILSDIVFPAGEALRRVASGDVFGDPAGPVGADNKASATAMQNARRNPSGVDMQAEAAKAAKRAGVGQPKAASGTRDHYAPRAPAPSPPTAAPATPAVPFTGTVSNND